MLNELHYKGGYKYQVDKLWAFQTKITTPTGIVSDYISLTSKGYLTIQKGYAWDGPSGPTFDSPLFMLGSLPHDALYQLMRMGLLSHDNWREADHVLKDVIEERLPSQPWYIRSLWKVRMPMVMAGLKLADGSAALPKNAKPVVVV